MKYYQNTNYIYSYNIKTGLTYKPNTNLLTIQSDYKENRNTKVLIKRNLYD